MKPHPTDFISSQVRKSECFFLDLNPPASLPFAVTCGGIETCRPDYCIDRKRFLYFGIEYIISGSCSLELNGRSYGLRAGSIFTYTTTTPHRIRNTGDGDLVKAFVDVTGRRVNQTLSGLWKIREPVQVANLRGMHELFILMMDIGQQGGKDVQESVTLILRLIARMMRSNAVEISAFHSQGYSTYQRCVARLRGNYRELGSVAELADSCHVSTAYLSRLFRKYADESPSDMLLRLKMNEAGKNLLKDDVLIKEAAASVGFRDPYHFSRLFRNYHGVSPSTFRSALEGSGNRSRKAKAVL